MKKPHNFAITLITLIFLAFVFIPFSVNKTDITPEPCQGIVGLRKVNYMARTASEFEGIAHYQQHCFFHFAISKHSSYDDSAKLAVKSAQTPLPTAQPSSTPSPTPNNTSTILSRLEFTIDDKSFQVINHGVKRLGYDPADIMMPYLAIQQIPSATVVAEIFDMNVLMGDKEQRMLDAWKILGGEAPSTLRSVVINGKTHQFTHRFFAEGHPTNDSETCYSVGGYSKDFFVIKENGLGIVINKEFSSKGCEGQPEKIQSFPEKKVVEQALKIIESMKIKSTL